MLNLIVHILSEYVDLENMEINEKTNPVTDLNLNSYDYISMVGRLEAELGISIPEKKLRSFETLGDLNTYIKEHIQG